MLPFVNLVKQNFEASQEVLRDVLPSHIVNQMMNGGMPPTLTIAEDSCIIGEQPQQQQQQGDEDADDVMTPSTSTSGDVLVNSRRSSQGEACLPACLCLPAAPPPLHAPHLSQPACLGHTFYIMGILQCSLFRAIQSAMLL